MTLSVSARRAEAEREERVEGFSQELSEHLTRVYMDSAYRCFANEIRGELKRMQRKGMDLAKVSFSESDDEMVSIIYDGQLWCELFFYLKMKYRRP